MTVLLEARGVGKRFPAVQALADVDFELLAGEVHALIGENGAGKSTLVKVLSGEITEFDGVVAVLGDARRFGSPREALAAGIAVIPQELQLVTSLSVAENIFLGREPRTAGGLVDRAALNRRADAQLAAMGTHGIVGAAPLSSLDTASRQLVAIARALSLDARCLIMDEPTASLGAEEARHLERVIQRLVSAGTGVLYISHKLDEVRRLADRVTVLRDGERVVTRAADGLTEDEMVRLMVGRVIERGELGAVSPNAARTAVRRGPVGCR